MVLSEGRIVKEQVKHYHIEDDLRLGCGLKLFDFLAESISSFVHEHKLADLTLPLGMYNTLWQIYNSTNARGSQDKWDLTKEQKCDKSSSSH